MNIVVGYLQPDGKSGVLSYRRKFPKDLMRFIPSSSPTGRGRVEFKVSIRAKSLNAPGAMDRFQAAQQDYEKIVAAAEHARQAEAKRAAGEFDELDEPTIAYLARRYVVDALATDQERRRDPDAKARASSLTEIARKVGHEFPKATQSANWTHVIRLAHSTMREAARSMRASGDDEGILGSWGELAVSMASDCGYELKPGGRSYRELCFALNDAAAEAHGDALRRLDGDLVPTPSMPEPPRGMHAPVAEAGGVSLLELFDRYASMPGRHPKTMAQWKPYIAQLAKFTGRDDVRDITHEDLVAWRNHLRDEATYRGQRLSAKTINGSYLGAASALLAWARGDGLISRNPMLEVSKVKLPAKPTTRVKAFTAEEAGLILQASLDLPPSREGENLRNAKRWCPWLMAYSGARVNEITQLRREDVMEQDGIPVLRLTPEAGTIKSNIARIVPIHTHLIDQGFLEFVAGRPSGPLFFDPERRRSDSAINRQANRLGSKLAEWVRTLGILAVKPNHGWRHLFSSLAVRYQLDPRATKAITGHASRDVHGTYITPYVDVLARELEKLPRFLD